MKIIRCKEDIYSTLAEIWKRSVMATHDFLSIDDFHEIKDALIPEYFPNVDLYAIIDNDSVTGFIGIVSDSIEMLFIDSSCRGKGYGTALLDFVLRSGASKVDVNEQNVSALGFYKAKGFRVIGRNETDEAGRPYPILHLSL